MPIEVHKHFVGLLNWLVSPEVFSQIGLYIGIGVSMVGFATKVFKKLWSKLEEQQNQEIDSIKKSIEGLAGSITEMQKAQERDFLRLQIVTGIHSGRLSTNEVLTLYDRYVQNGGNSYISRIVNDYVEEEKSKEEVKRNARKRN